MRDRTNERINSKEVRHGLFGGTGMVALESQFIKLTMSVFYSSFQPLLNDVFKHSSVSPHHHIPANIYY